MGRRRVEIAVVLGLALAALGFVSTQALGSAAGVNADEVFADPSGDNPKGNAPDLTRITVSSASDGQLRIRIDVSNRSVELATDGITMYMDTDLDANTGSSGSDYRIEAYGGDPGVHLAHFEAGDWRRVTSSSFSGSFSGGITASMSRADLGNTKGFRFFVYSVSNGLDPDYAPDDASSGTRFTATLGSSSPPPPPPISQLAKLIKRDRSGVVRIDVATCAGKSQGTGFVVGPRLVATVEHVIHGARTIALRRDGKALGSATVIGRSPGFDLALLRTAKTIAGYEFPLAHRTTDIGESVAVLGYPLALGFTFTRGSVSAVNRTIRIEGVARRGLVQTDAAVNPGNSGGPLLSIETEDVVGLVTITNVNARGTAFAVSSRIAAPLLAKWRAAPRPVAPAKCAR